ncbi:MAG: hypothetical protein EA426_13565 [Spirochaetaceae bacterium]|nr:MAG: hypothetical protein EA426_13565 [Spirochaetaceae bacterium]
MARIADSATASSFTVAARPGVILRDAATVLRAPLIKNEPVKGALMYHVVSITDMNDFGFLITPKKTIKIKEKLPKARKYELEPFDVLLTIVGTIGKITILPDALEGQWIPASNMLIVRFTKDKLDNAIAFVMFMKSRYGVDILTKLTHGTTIPIVSKKAFSRVVIPQLTPEVKKESKELFTKEERLYLKRQELEVAAQQLRGEYLA